MLSLHWRICVKFISLIVLNWGTTSLIQHTLRYGLGHWYYPKHDISCHKGFCRRLYGRFSSDSSEFKVGWLAHVSVEIRKYWVYWIFWWWIKFPYVTLEGNIDLRLYADEKGRRGFKKVIVGIDNQKQSKEAEQKRLLLSKFQWQWLLTNCESRWSDQIN